jgi:Kef-type K+ transport system membrane component KefB
MKIHLKKFTHLKERDLLRKNWFYYTLVIAVAASAITHYTGMSAILQFIIAGIAVFWEKPRKVSRIMRENEWAGF